MQDEHDVRLVQEHRDQQAFNRLYTRWHDKVKYTVCRHYLPDDNDADDFLQEFWLHVWTKIEQFEHRSAFGTWLYRVLRNQALNFLQKRNRRTHVEDQFDEMDEELLYEADSVLDGFDLLLIEQAFERTSKRLPPPILEVWSMHHSGMSYQEIQDEYHWAYKTLREYVYLANLILREELLNVTDRENDLNA